MADAGIRIRSYNVGFGDCFLLTFPEGNETRNVLIDFGCAPGQSMLAFDQIVENIHEETKGHLDVVVLSHEHIDHVSGFLSQQKKFDKFTVDYVWMGLPSKPGYFRSQTAKTMQRVRTQAAQLNAQNQENGIRIAPTFQTLVSNNLDTADAVQYVRSLPETRGRVEYLKRGDCLLGKPFASDVRVKVLAPEACVSEYYPDFDEVDYDLISDLQSVSTRLDSKLSDKNKTKHPIFGSKDYRNTKCVDNPKGLAPRDWRLLRKKNHNFGVQEIRALDCAINNTSLVLLFQINGKTLLFPGDAEVASWEWLYYAMHYCEPCIYDRKIRCPDCSKIKKETASIDFLKVSDHGSKSGTPEWLLQKLEPSATVMVSSKSCVYGTKNTIPDAKLLSALEQKHGPKLHSTIANTHKLWVDATL